MEAIIARATKQYGPHGIERYDGEATEVAQLTDILQGASLFASEKLAVFRDASRNKALWEALPERLLHLPGGIDLCFIENAPDKRTKTYKALLKLAEAKEYPELSEIDAAEWLLLKARQANIVLPGKVAQKITRIAGVDQWRLSNELSKLSAYTNGAPITEAAVDELVEPTSEANVFALLDAVLGRQTEQLERHIRVARSTEDPYKLIGLLSSQILQLAALVYAEGKTPETIAKDFKVHPYPLKKMQPLARRTTTSEMQMIATTVAELDMATKSVALDPWLLLEHALIKIANR